MRKLGGRSLWRKLEAWLIESDNEQTAPVDEVASSEETGRSSTGVVARDPSHFLPGHRRLRDVSSEVDSL